MHTHGAFIGGQGCQHHDLISHWVILSWDWANQSLPYRNTNNADLGNDKYQFCSHWFNSTRSQICLPQSTKAGGRGEIAKLVRVRGRWPWGRILVTVITFSCAAIHFPVVCNLQHDWMFLWCGRLKIPWVCKSVDSGFLLHISHMLSPPWYNLNTIAMA